MRLPTTILLLLVAAAAQAAPPVVTVPAEVAGEVAAFVVVKAAVTDAKAVKFVPLDSGLSVFPSGLLSDPTVTVVVAQRAGRFRILCYSGNADGPSEPAVTTVVIGGATVPIIDPKDPDPVAPPTTAFYFAVVRPDGPVAPATAAALRLPAWDALRAAGHLMKDFEASKLPTGVPVPPMIPAVVTLKRNADGKTWTVLDGSKPLPTSDTQVKDLLR
jgi:hypothetical protein